MSLAILLQAAEFLDSADRRDHEAEHGYASSHVPASYDLLQTSSKKSKLKKSQGNSRAHLRGCLERLKELVPLGSDSSRHTTLGLLNKAKCFIRNLEDKDKKQRSQKVQLIREQRHLLRRLDQLAEEAGLSQSHKFTHRSRSISESSSGISSASTSPTSEVGDCDMDSSSQADFQALTL